MRHSPDEHAAAVGGHVLPAAQGGGLLLPRVPHEQRLHLTQPLQHVQSIALQVLHPATQIFHVVVGLVEALLGLMLERQMVLAKTLIAEGNLRQSTQAEEEMGRW